MSAVRYWTDLAQAEARDAAALRTRVAELEAQLSKAEASISELEAQAVETPQREATPKKEATGARSAVAGDGPLVRFGRNKGQRVASLSQGDLDWYIRALRENVNDPTRAKFRAQNEAHLAECEALDPGVQPDVDEDMQYAHNARDW